MKESGDKNINSKATYIIFLSDGKPDPIESNGETIATELKNMGVKIYSVGLSVNEEKYLRNIASFSENDEYLKLINNAEELVPMYNELAVKIISAGTDAYITDVISDDFEYYEDETHKPTEGAILLPPDSEDGKTIKWHQSEVTPEETIYEFYIKVKDGEEHENGNWPTNESADVTYKNKEGEEEIVTVGSPVLGRHRYDVEHYLEQEDGSYKLEEKESYLAEEGEKVVAKTNTYETYTFNKDIEGTVLDGIIEETGRTVLKLYYDKIESNVVVRYVDRNGIDISNIIELRGKVGESYTTERKEIKGYVSYGEEPKNAIGEYTEEGQEVIYMYDKLIGKVIVEYVDIEGKDIANIDTYEGMVGEEYETKRKEIEGYIAYGKEPENAKGEYIKGEIMVTYVYDKEVVDTSDINAGVYVVISLVAIVGIVGVVYFVVKNNKKKFKNSN